MCCDFAACLENAVAIIHDLVVTKYIVLVDNNVRLPKGLIRVACLPRPKRHASGGASPQCRVERIHAIEIFLSSTDLFVGLVQDLDTLPLSKSERSKTAEQDKKKVHVSNMARSGTAMATDDCARLAGQT